MRPIDRLSNKPDLMILLVGFVSMLVLMVTLLIVGLTGMTGIKAKLDTIVNEQNTKTEIAQTMRFAARERSIDLISMSMMTDWLEKDEHFVHFNEMASIFIGNRQRLLDMQLSEEEKAVLVAQGEISKNAYPLQEEIVDLLMEDGTHELARKRLIEEAIPITERVLAELSKLIEIQNSASELAFAAARDEYQSARRTMALLGLFSILLGIIVASFVITKMRKYGRARLRAEHRLLHSQKMEALGKLTGGVAHDYNNMLAVILGYAELLAELPDATPQSIEFADEIRRAGQRGAQLTKKLLAFSKLKSADSVTLDVNSIVKDQKQLLEKTLTVRIQLQLLLAADLWPVRLDGGDLADAIINISINAMHAMPLSGQLTIETGNIVIDKHDSAFAELKAGEYVLLTLSDTGCGMDETSQSRIFEPFYTTKGKEGTGLGLSQVYGFVERSGGAIRVDSKPEMGTRISICFPRSDQPSKQRPNTAVDATGTSDIAGSVLLVDDEPGLLKLTAKILKDEGYEVFCSESAKHALKVLETQSIDVLLSDVLMPEMDGYELAAIAKKKYPELKIQLASGFDGYQHAEAADESLHRQLLSKPFDSQTLIQRVRELLSDNPPPES